MEVANGTGFVVDEVGGVVGDGDESEDEQPASPPATAAPIAAMNPRRVSPADMKGMVLLVTNLPWRGRRRRAATGIGSTPSLPVWASTAAPDSRNCYGSAMRARLLRTLPLLSLLLAACSSTEGTKDTTSADGGPASSVPASSPELPTTTAAVGPTEVVSDMGVYQVLGNQGLLYSVPRLLVNGEEVDTSFLGGFEVHVTSDGKTFGLMQDSEGLNAQDTLLETVLWAFAYQDSQFGDFAHRKVDIGGYIEYLRTSGGIDPSVVFPKQLSMYATGAEPSEPIRVDLALPIVITNTGITSIESAQPQELFYIHAIKNGDIQVALGVTADGQLIYDVNEASRSGTTSPLRLIENSSGSLLTTSFGAVFADVGNITWPASPEDHLAGPYFQFLNLIMVEKVPDKFLVPDITRFSYITLEGIGDDRVFEVVHLS